MQTKIKNLLFSWRYLLLLLIPLVIFYYTNRQSLQMSMSGNFYNFFVMSAYPPDVALMALLCAGLVGLQTHDELEKRYQPMLFSKVSIDSWAWKTFAANFLTCALLVFFIWVGGLLICLVSRQLSPGNFLADFTMSPYFSIVSKNPAIALGQFIALDLVRMFFFGAMLSSIATFGAMIFKNRYLVLCFPALLAILFNHYAFFLKSKIFAWDYQILFHTLGRFMGASFSFIYFGSVCLIFYSLAYFALQRRARHE